MLSRRLSISFARFSKQANPQYLLFPTKFPIFPYYLYATRINKYYYEYLTKNNITHVVAAPLQPGVSKKQFTPLSLQNLIDQFKLKRIQQKSQGELQREKQSFQVENNNLIFDQQTKGSQQTPIHYVKGMGEIFPMGSLCKIFLAAYEKNQYYAHLRSQIRFQIEGSQQKQHEGPLIYVTGTRLKNQNLINVGGQHKNLLQLFNKITAISKINSPHIAQSSLTKQIQLIGGYLCTGSYFQRLKIYKVFSTLDLLERVKLLTKYYNEYLKVFEAFFSRQQQGSHEQINQKEIFQQIYQRSQVLLGQKPDVQYIKKIRALMASGRYPQTIVRLVQCQLQNIQQLGQGHHELNKKKTYLNMIVGYPFGVSSKQNYDISEAKKILDQDHYGMKKVKQRILEFIAVSKLKGQFKSKVLLLHGPPGVGKTSIVKSIAKCLNRPYARISLGGQYDTSILKGHRKTYLGAYPGKIFDTIYKSKVQNPVILLDQIDKVQRRVGGASLQDVIMQVLDPIQNHKFKDQYMDIQIDLSKVLFICTANELETIFPPLLDRLERIQVSGYTTGEKKQIFKRYVIKKSMQNAGIPDQIMTRMQFTQQALHSLIQGYCKEAGIRNLVRKSNKIFNKIALKYVKNQQFDRTITPKSLKDYLGLPVHKDTRLFEKIPPKGVMVGLAYNAFGGSIMYIQAAATNIRQVKNDQQNKATPQYSKGSLLITGNLHNVMKQSCQLALSYAKYITSTFFNNHFLQKNDIHLNFPQIQIGKDGPSAGVAITCAFVSLALNKPSVKEIAMTGQITLSGQVSPIGGVKQKIMGAKREGITHLIFPYQNKRDVQQLQNQVKDGVTFYYASHYYEVMELVFGLKVKQLKQQQATISN